MKLAHARHISKKTGLTIRKILLKQMRVIVREEQKIKIRPVEVAGKINGWIAILPRI
jgi:hypothetical protein